MKLKLLIISIFLGFILVFADSVDFTNWVVKVETKSEARGSDFQSNFETQAKTLIKKLLFDAEQTIEDCLSKNSKLSRQFERLNLKSKESDIKFLSDGSIISEYEIPITGPLLRLLIPGTGGGIPLATLCCPICKRPWPENQSVPADVKLVPLENELTPQYTGVLIDARDIILNPALFPKILTDENKEVYGLSFADSNYVITQGLVSYTTSLAEAFRSERLGINPLRITALKSTGLNKTDIVISTASAKMMHSSQHNLTLLEHCRVVILISE